MKLLAVDGVPCKEEEPRPESTSAKIRTLQSAGEDFEWYPTTEEISIAMKNDLRSLFKKEIIGSWRGREYFSVNDRDEEKVFIIKSFLDVGAGDGRIFHKFKNTKDIRIEDSYGIEIAQPFAEDLIQKDDVFLIGRDFFRTSLIDKHFSVIFSNPPYSIYMPWVVRLLQEANFRVMYLVIPTRWEHNQEITLHMKRYDVKTLGEYDFLEGDRPARAKVNLIRLMKPHRKINGEYYETEGDDSFDRWIKSHIGNFEEPEYEKEEDRKDLKLKNGTIADMVENYDYEMNSLLEAFKALANLPARIVSDLGMSKDKIIKQIKENIKTLKSKHWYCAFEKLSAINSRLTKNTRQEMLSRMAEFKTLDFNEDNIYSIILWVIKNFNKYTNQQILEIFDKLTEPGYIKAYKSNSHWHKDDWRYTKWGEKGKPGKYILDYRLVTHCYVPRYGEADSIITDLMVVCGSLGFPMKAWHVDYSKDGRLQEFLNYNEETAFTARLYKNGNLHLKINEKIMLRFNIEVARLRHWINGPEDIEMEYEVPHEEAIRLWKEPGLVKIGQSEILQLGFNSGKKDDA